MAIKSVRLQCNFVHYGEHVRIVLPYFFFLLESLVGCLFVCLFCVCILGFSFVEMTRSISSLL